MNNEQEQALLAIPDILAKLNAIAGSSSIRAKPYGFAVAEGDLPNHYRFQVFGQNSDVDSTVEDVWNRGGSYVFPTAPMRMKVVSTSVNDAGAGTGVKSVLIHYLDDNYAEQTETVTLNGTTAVNTVATNILRVQSMHTATKGSSNGALGTIGLLHLTDGTYYAMIDPGFNMAEQCVFTIPAGHTGYITSWGASSGSTGGGAFGKFWLRATCHLEVEFDFFVTADMIFTQDGGQQTRYEVPLKLPPTTDIKISAVSDALSANITACAHLNGWYELD